MEPVKRKNPLEQTYQSVADGFSGKKENSYDEPIFVLDEEWNTLKQEGSESPLSKEIDHPQVTQGLACKCEAPYATYKEYKEYKEINRKQDWNQWEAWKQLRINPRIPFK